MVRIQSNLEISPNHNRLHKIISLQSMIQDNTTTVSSTSIISNHGSTQERWFPNFLVLKDIIESTEVAPTKNYCLKELTG